MKKWAEAEVVRVDEGARRVLVTYTFWSDKWDEWLPFESGRIAAFGSRTYQRGSAPRAGQRIEALDETGQWLEAEVLETRGDGGAYVHYKGFHRKFDDWIGGDRIREFGRCRAVVKQARRPPQRTYAAPAGPESDDTDFDGFDDKVAGGERPERREGAEDALVDLVVESGDRPVVSKAGGGGGRYTRAIAASGDVFDRYQRCLRRRGLGLVRVSGDGNCLFRSVAHQVYGDDVHHGIVRRKCMDYMDAEHAFFEPYIEGDSAAFRRYVAAKRRDGAWGDEPEVQALCELYDRPAEIWSYDAAANAKAGGAKVLRTFHGAGGATQSSSGGRAMAICDVRRAPMRLSYYGGGHYDSIVREGEPGVLYCEPPGQLEDAAISRSRSRTRDAPREERRAVEASDVEATDAARVEAALDLSRRDFEAHDVDLEQTLRLSLEAAPTSPESEDDALQLQLDEHARRQAEADDLARALALSQRPWAPDADVHGDALQPPLDEEDALRRALADSARNHSPDADLAAAIDLSSRDSGEDAVLAAAIAASLEQR